MDIYKQRSIWNFVLLAVGILILGVTVIYANYLANQLFESEKKNQQLYIDSQSFLAKNQDAGDLTIQVTILESFTLPVILKRSDNTYDGRNWGAKRDTMQSFLQSKVEERVRAGNDPIVVEGMGGGDEIFIFPSPLYNYIKFFPWLQTVMIAIFVAFGYILFNATRKAEQNRVWAGMAKETAHQLGTPISAIIAWIEFLKDANSDKPDQLEVIGELREDVNRLELIADRFSKIGSEPELDQANIYDQLSEIETYMKRRSPRKVVFDFPGSGEVKNVNINQHLFTWVLENLIRNSLDALDGEGTIAASVSQDSHWVKVDISDTGKGIPGSKFKEVFKPGYSTKKRGWGLGLSLAKRIIEEYHKGKIFIKNSKPNEGTTFAIHLPRI